MITITKKDKRMPRTTQWACNAIFLIAALSILGCTQTTSPTKNHILDVRWESGFTMPELLSESITITTQSDIQALLKKPWYTPIAIKHAKHAEVRSLDNCAAYFANRTASLRALRDPENNALLELRTMCEATRLLANAAISTLSYLPEAILTAQAPQHFPKHMALVTSQREWDKHMQDAKKRVWADINTITHSLSQPPSQTDYQSETGLQQVSVVGRGDIDGDTIEDVILLSRDSTNEGSYFNLRLFVLTVGPRGLWREIPIDE